MGTKFLVYYLLLVITIRSTLLASSRKSIGVTSNSKLWTSAKDCEDSTGFHLMAYGPRFKRGFILDNRLRKGGRKRRWMKSRIRYYGNMSCTANFQVEYNQSGMILLAWDIQMNPGPIKNPGSVCMKPVATHHRAIKCKQCQKKCHIGDKCGKVDLSLYQRFGKDLNPNWSCPACLRQIVLQNESLLPTQSINDYGQEYSIPSEQRKVKDELSGPGLKIGHINVNGLRRKLAEIVVLVQETGLDILAMTETKLSPDTCDSQIGIDGFAIVRKDRLSNGGGVLLYVKESLMAYKEVRFATKEDDIEGVWINVLCQSQTWLVACIYRPPDNGAFFDAFNKVLEKVWMKRKNILLLGDFNSDFLFRGKTKEQIANGKRLKRIFSAYGLKNIVKEATRISETTQTLIDLIALSDISKITSHGVAHLGISDHSFIYANLQMRRKKSKLEAKIITSYKNFDEEKFKSDIQAAPWSVCGSLPDLEDQVWAWEHLFNQISSEHITTRKVRLRPRSLPWLNKDIKKAQNQQCKLLKRFKREKDPELWKQYKIQRNKIQKMLKAAEMQYWKDQFSSASNTKEFSNVVKKVEGNTKVRTIPPIADDDAQILTSDKAKADSFNKFFSGIGKKLAAKFESSDTSPENLYRVTPSSSCIKISEDLVVNKLPNIPKKAGGTDGICARELAAAGESLINGLYGIYSKSIATCKFRDNWKVGKVITAYKKGVSSNRENYRPLTMLNLTSKTLENIVCTSIDDHLIASAVLHPNQWAFQKGISTESLLLLLTETWKEAVDQGKKVGVIFVDFRKAYDTINHNILMDKIQAAGISGPFHQWIKSYLTNRRQYVAVNGERSDIEMVEMGVPQGSLLGPRLFAMYVNDLPDSTPVGYIHMFADDTTIYYIGKDPEEIVDALNVMLRAFYAWCQRNQLTVHTGKTEAMYISCSPFVGPMRKIKFGEDTIEFKTESKCLGVIIDNRLSWKPQVEAVCRKFLSKIRFLRRLKSMQIQTLEDIYYKGAISSVTYCIAVWGTTSAPVFNQLEKLHGKAAKLIYRLPSSTSDHEALQIANWMPISYIYKRRVAAIMYKIKNKALPDSIVKLFETKENHTSRELRRNTYFKPIQPRTEYGRISIRFRGPAIWKVIPTETKTFL